MESERWVEAQGKTVEIATQAALDELGLQSADQVDVEILQEPQRGLLGLGGRDAIVRVTLRPRKRRRRRGGRGRRGGEDKRDDRAAQRTRSQSGKSGRRPREGARRNREKRGDSQVAAGNDEQQKPNSTSSGKELPPLDTELQRSVIQEFLEGLVTAFGLEGAVATRVEEGILYAEVTGEQTEALVGAKGSILQAILELCRTVVQRKSFHSARIRLDIAGYAERRREALKIYARRLADKVIAEGGEIELEAMNPADRKVVHDVVAEIDEVRSFSEGEEPRRRVIIALAPGHDVIAGGEDAEAPQEEEEEDEEAAVDSTEDED